MKFVTRCTKRALIILTLVLIVITWKKLGYVTYTEQKFTVFPFNFSLFPVSKVMANNIPSSNNKMDGGENKNVGCLDLTHALNVHVCTHKYILSLTI